VSDAAPPPLGLIVNPKAGRGRGLRLLPRIVAALQSMEIPFHLFVTTEPNEATTVAKNFVADGVAIVVAVGGDGTINEVVNGLIDARGEAEATLAIIPAGRGCDFVRGLGLDRHPMRGVARIPANRVRRVDLGHAQFSDGTSRYFVNVFGAGFDADVAARATSSHLPGQTAPYLWSTARSLIRNRAYQVATEADGILFTSEVTSVVVANGAWFGGGINIMPGAQMTDGSLDVGIISHMSRFELLRALPSLYRGRHLQHPRFTRLSARSIRLDTGQRVPVQLDGEVGGATPVTITLKPKALPVLV
jgi:YegS/Rv2252/BmrU family lipid kinase